MANIAVTDDDLALDLLVDNLNSRGHVATRYASAQQALDDLDEIASADLIILDVIMDGPDSFGAEEGESTSVCRHGKWDKRGILIIGHSKG